MLTPVDNSQRTRWNELCDIVKIILKIGVIFDSNGVDIYFLNRQPMLRVKDPRTVEQEFEISAYFAGNFRIKSCDRSSSR